MMSGYHSDEEGEAVQEEVSNRVGVSNSDPSNDTKQKSVGKSLTSMDTQMEDFLKVLHYTLVLFVLIAIYTVDLIIVKLNGEQIKFFIGNIH